MITIYSTPNCIQCKATAREMDRKGIEYDMVDMSADGFRPDKISALAS